MMLGKAAADPNPDMKIKCASFCSQLAVKLDKKVGSYMKAIVDSMVQNLSPIGYPSFWLIGLNFMKENINPA